jgi:hypothetical protein
VLSRSDLALLRGDISAIVLRLMLAWTITRVSKQERTPTR